MHDRLGEDIGIPIFVMAKSRNSNFILIPDFEALKELYQVLPNRDITQVESAWNEKKSTLVWRGSSVQRGFDNNYFIRRNNMHQFSRIKLCQLSLEYPELIDAKFTIIEPTFIEDPAILQKYKGDFLSYDAQLFYKYHILVDGSTCSFSHSGWKFFLNSLIIKPDSAEIQWHYNELKPWVHYVPVNSNLNDLVDRLLWAKRNDSEAERMAKNALILHTPILPSSRIFFIFTMLLSNIAN